MRILHVIASCDPRGGGPIEGVRRLGEAFRVAGHEQELLTLDTPDQPWVREHPATVHALGTPVSGRGPIARLRRRVARSPDATAWLRRHGRAYDGIIVDGLWNYSTRVARLALPGGDTPYIVFTHGMLDPWFAGKYPLKHALKQVFWRFNEGVLLRGAAAVAFTCEQERRLARRSFAPWRMREAVVGFGTSLPPPPTTAMEQAFRATVPALGMGGYLLFMSRIHEKKGVDVLIAAFAEIAAAFPAIDLVIGGTGAESYVAALRRQAEASGYGARIHWPGMLGGDAKWGAFYACDAMVLSSHQENFGVVVAEAAGCAKRVVISDQVNIFDEVAAANAGFIASDEVQDFARALRDCLAQSPAERAAMEQRGAALFAEKFNIAATAVRLLNVFSAARSRNPIPRAE